MTADWEPGFPTFPAHPSSDPWEQSGGDVEDTPGGFRFRREVKGLRVFREVLHPRDRRGRFIEIGAHVSLWGGGTGEVLGNVDGDRIKVRRDADGRTFLYRRTFLTVTARPDGGTPSTDADTAAEAPLDAPDAPGAPRTPDAPDETPAPAPEPVTPVLSAPPEPDSDGGFDLFDLDAADAWDPGQTPSKNATQPVDDAIKPPDPPDLSEGPVREYTPQTKFAFRADRLDVAIGQIDKVNRKAERAGIPDRITYTVAHRKVDKKDPDTGLKYTVDYVDFEVNTPEVKRNGWTFVATLTWDPEAGLVSRVVPGANLANRPKAKVCNVCNSARDRKDTFVVQDGKGHEMQVGRNCLAQFLGIAPNLAVLEYEFDPSDVDDRDGERDGGGGLSRGSVRLDSANLLGVTLAILKDRAFISRNKAEQINGASGGEGGRTVLATVDQVMDVVNPPNGIGADVKRRNREIVDLADTPEMIAKAAEVLAVARTLEGDSEYAQNLRAIAGPDTVDRRNVALLVSAVGSWQRMQERATADLGATSKPVGTVGDKIAGVDVTIVGMQNIESDYGTKTLVKMQTPSGDLITWWSSSVIDDMEVGETFTLAATVKSHGAYRGVAETTVLRSKFTPTGETKKARDALAATRSVRVPDGMVEVARGEVGGLPDVPNVDGRPLMGLPVGTRVSFITGSTGRGKKEVLTYGTGTVAAVGHDSGRGRINLDRETMDTGGVPNVYPDLEPRDIVAIEAGTVLDPGPPDDAWSAKPEGVDLPAQDGQITVGSRVRAFSGWWGGSPYYADAEYLGTVDNRHRWRTDDGEVHENQGQYGSKPVVLAWAVPDPDPAPSADPLPRGYAGADSTYGVSTVGAEVGQVLWVRLSDSPIRYGQATIVTTDPVVQYRLPSGLLVDAETGNRFGPTVVGIGQKPSRMETP